MEELNNIKTTLSVDARGTACPGPLLEAKKAIVALKSGEILEVLSADEGTRVDIPKWCKKQEHEYLGTLEKNGYFCIFLRKK